MMKHAALLALTPALILLSATLYATEPVDYVDPLLGTSDSRWLLFPGPTMPLGMVKLSPDNQGDVPGKVFWKAGHEYTVENITGFSHIHSWTMGGLLCMPAVGTLQTKPGLEKDPDLGYRSRYRHSTEEAAAGYYAVTLDDYRIRAELTATTRTGVHRYTFPASDDARILLDLEFPTEYGFKVLEARFRKVSETEIEGFSKQRATSWAPWNDYTVHFAIRLSKPMDSLGGWIGDSIRHDVEQLEGEGDVGAFVNYKTTAGEAIQMQVGISLVSTEQARLNLETELAPLGWDFDAVRNNARNTWNELLSRIEVEGGTRRDRIKFYSNLYRSYCGRTTWSDVNGKYVDMYEKVQQAAGPDSPVYGCDAFWNTFWNLNQLWALTTPRITRQWVDSLLEIHDRGGWLPKGPTGIEYSSIMVASHEIALIVGAYQKGIRDFDVGKAYEAMRKIQMTPGQPHPGGGHVGNRQLQPYMDLGYVPVEKGRVSNTMEYAYDDWCVAQMAKALGKDDDHACFQKRSRNYQNVFDRSVGYVRRRHADGRWVEPFSPFSGKGFVEGNSWQYTWFVPHDVYGLINLMGREEFNRRLGNGFVKSEPHRFHAAVYDGTIQRIEEYYINHGNQPNMQAAYLFNYSGKPWETQRWVRAILDKYYGTGPVDGYPGDEDQGQMGAWFVMSAMGLFQVDGGCSPRPFYEIGSPLFERVVIHLDDRYYSGKSFIIETIDNSKDNIYIQSATLDGRPLDRPWFYHSDLIDGGKLVLQMGRAPNEKWGSADKNAPPSTF